MNSPFPGRFNIQFGAHSEAPPENGREWSLGVQGRSGSWWKITEKPHCGKWKRDRYMRLERA